MKILNLIKRLWTDSHEKQSPQRFVRYAAILIMLLTLGVGQMWGGSVSGGEIYFDATQSGWGNSLSSVDYIISHDSHSCWYAMTKIPNTNLYYISSGSWGDSKYFAFTANYGWTGSGDNCEGNSYDSRKGYGPSGKKYTAKSTYGVNSGSTYLFYASSSADDASITTSSPAGYLGDGKTYTALNYTQTLNQTLSTNGGNTYSTSTASIATVKVSSYKLNGASSSTSTSGTIAAASSSTSCSAARTATVTYTVSSIATGYEFVGWYDGSTQKSTSTTYTYNATAAKTITARFKETQYSLTFSHNGHGSISVGGAAVSSGSTANVNYFTTMTLVATPADGYHFTGWTLSGTNTGSVTIGNAANKSTTIKATNTGATVTAGFEVDAANYTITYGVGTSYTSYGSVTEGHSYASGSSQTSGTEISLTATPVTHYKLEGWYSDAACSSAIAGAGTTNPYEFTLGANTSVYAKFVLKQCTITLDRNGGSAGATSVTASHGQTLPAFTAHTRTGYTLNGYYTETSGGTKIINADGSLVASTSYANGSKQWNSDVTTLTLHAQWTEVKSTVSLVASPTGAGTFTSNASTVTSLQAGVTTKPSVTANPAFGYSFSSWAVSGGATISSTSSNPTTVTGKGAGAEATLTATFARTYSYMQGRMSIYNAARNSKTHIASSEGGWDTNSTRIGLDYDDTNHRFVLHTHMKPSELTAQQNSEYQWFKIKNGSTTYAPTSDTQITTAETKYSASSSGSGSYRINNSATSGYVVLHFDGSDVWYTLEQRLQYNANGGSGAAPTGDNGHNSYHAKDANATAEANTFTARKNYTFAGWNTAADITGTSYAAGASVPMSADRILYAKWNRSVTLDQQDATTDGSTSVTATWNCSTLPSITNPKKLGYEFGGWYTETAGNGNIIINTSGQLQASKTNWTVDGGKFQRTPSSDASESKPLYAMWTQTVTLNANTGNHGSGDNTSATIVYKATDKSSITHCTPVTGYHLEGYYTAATDGVKVLNADGSFASSAVTDYITDGKWIKAGATTLFAHYEPNTYDVILDVNGATTGSNQTVTATFDADMPTTQKGGSTPISAPSKTGYTFGGYWTNAAGTGTQYYTGGLASSHVWDVATNNTTIYAKWTPNPYTVTLDVEEDNHGTIASADVSASVTYDAAPSTIANRPTAANGYALDGYYTDHLGGGTKVINGDGTWIASVTGYTDGDAKWVHVGDVTFYAYYKKAEITALTITPSTAGLGATVTVTPTIDPMPTGNYNLCWKLLRNNDNEITGTTFTPTADDTDDPHAVQFTAPGSSGNYKVQCILSTGSTACAGTPLSSRVQNFTVAGEHTVTIRYQDASGRTLAASTEVTGRPLTWSEVIAAPPITGYTFARWEAGDGIILSTNGISELGSNTTTEDPVYVEATYAGNLTAVYNKKNVLYFNNTLGWEHVYVYFYSNGNYWNSNKNNSGTTEENVFGSGANTTTTNYSGVYTGHYGEMTRIAGTNIYYFDWQAEGWSQTNYVTFTKDDRHDYEWFDNTEVVRLADAAHYYDKPGTMMMYVPLPAVYEIRNRHDANLTKYYTEGYWMNYPDNTGYTLKIYNSTTKNTDDELLSIPFEFNSEKNMPMSLNVELEAGRTYGFEIKRNDGTYYGNDNTMKINASGDFELSEDVWEFTSSTTKRAGLKTSVAGDYKFTLKYGEKTAGNYYYLVGVHYPVAANDYRIVYTESGDKLWSGHNKPTGWYHPSRAIHKSDGAKDIVSFYVNKADGVTATMKFQYASNITNEGVVTWTDVEGAGGTINLNGITSSGVYNFHLTQADGSISVEKIEAYAGNYYIRTDCAGTTKWDNYRAADHQMTYSEFSKDRATNTFGELYTHYYMHWCPRETNIKFVIANDYSMCITDTLESDITDLNNIAPGGYLNSQKDEGKSETDDIYSANIRFMYDERTNKISRAYMSSSTNTVRKFLVLKSDTEFKNSDNTVLRGSGESRTAGNYEAIFKDNEDWIYEREIRLAPGQKFKLYASYAQSTAQEEGSQHFRGNYASNDWASADNYVLLVGGSGDTCNARIVYDYKTNRLISAYLPDNDNAISGSPSINADIMIVRNHQEAGQQITFNTGASLNAVQTVYGVMRFNRWILNNRQHPEDMDRTHSEDNTKMNSHHPLITDPGSQRSSSERGLYWISFPFNVNLSEVFGFGTYGIHWIVMKYNGEERAKQGFWADSEGFWEYIWDRKDVVLEKGKGYVLALDLDRMKADDRTFWNNEIQQVELFFPSTATVGTIQQTDVNVDVPAWTCTIGPRFEGGDDRTKKDSHWNIIGVPSYANYNSELTDGSAIITWNANPETQDLPFLYEWNANDNTYTVQSGTSYPFKAMHAYYVQYHGTLHWSLASATPPSIVARRAYEKPQNEEFRLELQQNEKMVDQTFVKLSNDENASADFRFEEDLCKEFNSRKANIYTFIADVQAAGNTLPLSDQTTLVPVGVKTTAAGEYTFAMPEGTNGVGVVLVDNIAGTRTNLALSDYTVALGKGDLSDRFMLEIAPIKQMPTDIENVQGGDVQGAKARKVMVDGILYIVKDGKVFDAQGKRLQ